jgi:hypothetical protein
LLGLAFLADFAAVSCLDAARRGTFAAARNVDSVHWVQAKFRSQVDKKMPDARTRYMSQSASCIAFFRRTIPSQLHHLTAVIALMALAASWLVFAIADSGAGRD